MEKVGFELKDVVAEVAKTAGVARHRTLGESGYEGAGLRAGGFGNAHGHAFGVGTGGIRVVSQKLPIGTTEIRREVRAVAQNGIHGSQMHILIFAQKLLRRSLPNSRFTQQFLRLFDAVEGLRNEEICCGSEFHSS